MGVEFVGRSRDSRGVSPVIGVILMVAITVILAAVLGSFVLDIGQQAENDSPQAAFRLSASAATDQVEIRHLGGDRLVLSETRIVIENNGDTTFGPNDSATGDGVLSVGDVSVVTLNASGNPDSIDFDGDGADDVSVDGPATPVSSGDRITVRLIDIGTQRVIYEGSIQVTD